MNKLLLGGVCLVVAGLVGCVPTTDTDKATTVVAHSRFGIDISATDLDDSIRCYTTNTGSISCVHIPSKSTSSEWHVNETCSN